MPSVPSVSRSCLAAFLSRIVSPVWNPSPSGGIPLSCLLVNALHAEPLNSEVCLRKRQQGGTTARPGNGTKMCQEMAQGAPKSMPSGRNGLSLWPSFVRFTQTGEGDLEHTMLTLPLLPEIT